MESIHKEAKYRGSGKVVDMECYHDLRRGCSGARICFALFEPVLGIDLPDEVVDHPAFKEISVIGLDLYIWCNVSSISSTTSSALIVSYSIRIYIVSTWSNPGGSMPLTSLPS